MSNVPMFIKNAERRQIAERIAKVFNIQTVDEFKDRLAQRVHRLSSLFGNGIWIFPFRGGEIQHIGTRP